MKISLLYNHQQYCWRRVLRRFRRSLISRKRRTVDRLSRKESKTPLPSLTRAVAYDQSERSQKQFTFHSYVIKDAVFDRMCLSQRNFSSAILDVPFLE